MTDDAQLVPLETPRQLADEERALVDFLLSGPLGRPELRAQAETATVVGVCTCGCPSIQIGVDPSLAHAVFAEDESPMGRPEWVPIAARGPAGNGADVEVILHVVDGTLYELEIWPWEEGRRAPAPAELRLER